jgi:hypothetical protein
VLNPVNGAAGNGTREAGEPGIPGVTVDLHFGDCVSQSVATSITDANGQYLFKDLSEGPYCVTIDAGSPNNTSILQPGLWTKPTSPTYFVQQADVLPNAGTLTFDFAWDFKNQPVSNNAPIPTAAPQATATPNGVFFAVDVPANCRSGPDTVYPAVTSYLAGTYLTLTGRNTNSTWWYVQVSSSQNCWISNVTGHTTGDTASLPVVAAPPTPVPTATTVGSDGAPILAQPIAVYASLDYPSTNCGANIFNVAIRATDTNLDSVWLQYRVLSDGGYVGSWSTLTPNDNASGGLYGFNYDLNTQFSSELSGADGTIQYQFYAKDTAGNTASYPSGSPLGIPLTYCP